MVKRSEPSRRKGVAPKPDPAQATPAATSSVADQVDRELVRRGIEKLRAGQRPTDREAAAIKKYERAKLEENGLRFVGAIPQKFWREWSGRQAKVINEQSQLYKIPFGGAEISLPDVVRALHDFLAKHGRKLASDEDDDPLLSGADSPWLERYRKEKALLARMDRLQRRGDLLPRQRVHEGFGRIAGLLRRAGEWMRKKSPEAYEILNEALDDADREISALVLDDGQLAPHDDSNDQTQPDDAGTIVDAARSASAQAANNGPVRRSRNRRPKRPL